MTAPMVALTRLRPTPLFVVTGRSMTLEEMLEEVSKHRRHQTRTMHQTILEQLRVVLPASSTTKMLVLWSYFLENVEITDRRLTFPLDVPRKRCRNPPVLTREVPRAFARSSTRRAEPRTAIRLSEPVEASQTSSVSVWSTRTPSPQRNARVAPSFDFDTVPEIAQRLGFESSIDSDDDSSIDFGYTPSDYPETPSDEDCDSDDEEETDMVEDPYSSTTDPSPSSPLSHHMMEPGEILESMSEQQSPPSLPPPKECSICCAEFTKDRVVPMSQATDGTYLIKPPCHPQHAACGECHRRLATQWHNHPIGPGSDSYTCPHDGCSATYPTADFKGLLSDEDMKRLQARENRFKNREVIVSCPRCGSIVPVPQDRLRDSEPGTVVFQCCTLHWCFHCFSPVGRSNGDLTSPSVCIPCIRGQVTWTNINRFFIRPQSCLDEGMLPPLMRNYELSLELVLKQIIDMCESDVVDDPCAGCGTKMHRSSECNELSHCGIHRCAHCGMSGFEWETHLIDHFHGEGRCPLYPSSDFWHRMGLPSLCDHKCQNDSQDCKLPEHRDRIEAQTDVRRLQHIQSAMNSLPKELKDQVVEAMQEREDDISSRALTRFSMALFFQSAAYAS